MTIHNHYFHGRKEHSTTYAAASFFMPGAAARVEAIRVRKRKLKHTSPPPEQEAPVTVIAEGTHTEEAAEAHDHEAEAEASGQEQAESPIGVDPVATKNDQVHESQAAILNAETAQTPPTNPVSEEWSTTATETENLRSKSPLQTANIIPAAEPADPILPRVSNEVDTYLVSSASEISDLASLSQPGTKEPQTETLPDIPNILVDRRSTTVLAALEAEGKFESYSDTPENASHPTALGDTEDTTILTIDNDMTIEQADTASPEVASLERATELSEALDEPQQPDCLTSTRNNHDKEGITQNAEVSASASALEPEVTHVNDDLVIAKGEGSPDAPTTPELPKQIEEPAQENVLERDEDVPQPTTPAAETDADMAAPVEIVVGEDELKLDTSIIHTSTISLCNSSPISATSSLSSPSGRRSVRTEEIEWVKRSEFD